MHGGYDAAIARQSAPACSSTKASIEGSDVLGQGFENLLPLQEGVSVPTLEPSYPARTRILPGIPDLGFDGLA
jgi:hypothetical protein